MANPSFVFKWRGVGTKPENAYPAGWFHGPSRARATGKVAVDSLTGARKEIFAPLLGGAKSCPNSNKQIAWQDSLGCEICGCHSPSVSVSFETSREDILEDMPDGN